MAKEEGAYLVIEGLKLPKQKSQVEKAWKEISGKMHPKVEALKKAIPGYSYQNRNNSLLTDERLCALFVKSLSDAKKSLYSISDLLFSLHTKEELIPLTTVMRDELDIFSDEVKIRHCEFRDPVPSTLSKIITHDLALLNGLKKMNSNITTLSRGILAETKRKKSRPDFWKNVRKALLQIRKQIRELVILFKEREALCNIHPITLERTFKAIQQEIRGKV